ncbi:MAG: FtsQ-type POTRA domain-containing protein [Acidobacteria bacterium]|nr:FtsQ-type POTRA domain-containing protein [Acidobacteriota bacterium]
MAKRQSEENEQRFLSIRKGLWIAVFVSMGLVVLLWSAIQLEAFLIRDPQFTLASPPDPGDESAAVEIAGVKNSARSSVSTVFERDHGRSIYLVPLRHRREELLRLRWVKDATVTRVWPNRMRVQIVEREPVAYVQLPGEEDMPLIDVDGNMLPRETQAALDVPILTGVTRQMDDQQRRSRAQRLAKLMRDTGELSAQISEVDATDPDNLKVVQDAGGKAVTLVVGNRHFKRRLEKFRQNAAEMLRREPDKTVFDLRQDNSIFQRGEHAVRAEGNGPGE